MKKFSKVNHSHSYLYKNLAEHFIEQILNGAYVSGSKLPSIRRTCKDFGVSSNTVLNAYRLLENKGIIEARAQSGFFVLNETMSMSSKLIRVQTKMMPREVRNSTLLQAFISSTNKHGSHPFSIATISPNSIPKRDISNIITELAQDENILTRCLMYSNTKGEPEFLSAIARRYGTNGLLVSADEIIITNGCLDALSFCLRAISNPGDTIAVETPTYYGLLMLLESMGLHALEISTDPKEGLCLDELETCFKTKQIKSCIFTSNYQNPLGFSMSDESKKKLVDLGDKYRIPLIEDDVFGECSYDNKRPRPAKYFDKKGNVMLCSSFSKSVAPGLRVGWVASGRYTERISELKLSSNLSTSPFNQLVMSRFLESHKFDKHISVLRRTLAHQTMRVRFAVKEHFPKGTSVTRPCGGFVLWVQLPVEYDSVAIQKQAYNESILIIRGTLFSTSGRFRNCLRLNCGYAWQDDLDVAIKRLGEIICNSIKLGK